MTNATARSTRSIYNSEPEPLEDFLAETGLDWTPDGTRFAARLNTCRIVAERQGERVVFRVELAHLNDPSPASLEAIADFLGALNSRLRFARGSVSADKVLLEATIPGAAWTAEDVGEAMGALSVGILVARKECAALLNQLVARHYLNFHNKGETSK